MAIMVLNTIGTSKDKKCFLFIANPVYMHFLYFSNLDFQSLESSMLLIIIIDTLLQAHVILAFMDKILAYDGLKLCEVYTSSIKMLHIDDSYGHSCSFCYNCESSWQFEEVKARAKCSLFMQMYVIKHAPEQLLVLNNSGLIYTSVTFNVPKVVPS